MKGHLFVICGASGSGKSTLTEMISEEVSEIFRSPKYSTREYRPRTSSNPVTDDITQVSQEDFFKNSFDLAYVANGNYYGIKTEEINLLIAEGRHLLLSITDFRAVFRLKAAFGENCTTIALLSAIDQLSFIATHGNRKGYNPTAADKKDMQRLYRVLDSAGRLGLWREVFGATLNLIRSWQSTVPDLKQAESRAKKVRIFQTRYLENSHHFDYAVLNYRKGEQGDMLSQFELIYRNIVKGKKKAKNDSKVLLVVAAASGSGKGTLLESLRIIAPKEVRIVEKEGKREPRSSDKNDGLNAIGVDGNFSSGFNIVYQMHRDPKTSIGTKYAFSEKNIREGFEGNKVQVAIANVLLEPKLLQDLRNSFGDMVRVVYLMRFGAEEEIEAFQKSRGFSEKKTKRRITQNNDTYTAYTKMTTKVDHVLLNTENREDLYDQMFRLLEFYRAV